MKTICKQPIGSKKKWGPSLSELLNCDMEVSSNQPCEFRKKRNTLYNDDDDDATGDEDYFNFSSGQDNRVGDNSYEDSRGGCSYKMNSYKRRIKVMPGNIKEKLHKRRENKTLFNSQKTIWKGLSKGKRVKLKDVVVETQFATLSQATKHHMPH